MKRRGFLFGMLAAPAVITTPKLLMPVKPVYDWTPVSGIISRSALAAHLWPSIVEHFGVT